MPLIAMLAALFAPGDARADVRRRAYLPTTAGVNGIDLGPDTSSFPGWGVGMPSVLGFSPDGQWMYGIEASSGAFLTYSLASSSSPALTFLGLTSPAGIAVTPDGLTAYVGLIGGNVAVVDLLGPVPSVATTIITPPLTHIVMSPEGDGVYTTTATGNLLRISTAVDIITQIIPLGAGITPKGLDITPDGLRAAVSGLHSGGMGVVILVNLPTGAAPLTAINIGGDPRNLVITPDGTTALVADYEGRVLFIDLATGDVSDSHTNLTPLNALGSIDVEPSGQYAWFFDSGTDNLWRLDLTTRTSGVLTNSPNTPDINGKFIGKPVFFFAGSADVVNSDAELTTMGFGREVIIEGGAAEVNLAAGFTSDRTFLFNATGADTPQLGVTGQVTLTGILRGSGFELTGGGPGILTTTGNYQIGPTTVTNASLLVEGTHNGEITVNSGGILRGTGTVGNLNVEPGGSVRPGAAVFGRLTSGATFFENGSTLWIDIAGTTAGTNYDQLDTPLAVLHPGVTLQTTLGYTPAPGDTFMILRNHSSGTFASLPDGSTHDVGGFAAFVRYPTPPNSHVTLQIHTPPTAAPIANASIDEDTTYNGSVTIGDDLTPAGDLNLLVTSSNQTLVPDANILWGSGGSVRSLQIAPAAGQSGSATITVRVSDANFFVERSFVLTVDAVNDAPTISSIAPRTIEQDSTTGAIPFTITDVDGFDGHLVTASSSNPTLVPNDSANLTIGGAAGARTITVTPAAGQHGAATITVTVDDGDLEGSTTFLLTVNAPPPEPPTAITYYLAEGATGPFFDTDLLLANPNAVAAPITLTWMLEGGGTLTQSRTLAPMSRTTIEVDAIEELEAAAFSTTVTSTEGHAIGVERTMRWGSGGYGSHTEKATDPGGTTWYFAEGSAGYFSTYLLLGNPQPSANTAHVTWLREGEPELTRSYPLLPNSRYTVDTRADAELIDRAFGARVVFDQPGVAERAMYFGTDLLWSGGHGAAGQTSLATRWDFAEGATGTYFTTFLLLANPGVASAEVTLTFFPEGGTPVSATYTLAAGQRMTRNVAFEHPSLANAAVAARVTSTEPIVAERAQYWGVPEWIESHNSFGVTNPGRRWVFAEGRVGGDDGAQTYVLLSNPGDSAATATLTFLRTDGTTIVKPVDVPAASRVTVGVTGAESMVPELTNESFGTLIESTQPIIVERSLYSNANGVIWAAGTNATAAALPEP